MVNKRLIQLAEERGNETLPETKPDTTPDNATHNATQGTDPKNTVMDDYLMLENIVCTDSKGGIIEQHPLIYVAKNPERNQKNSLIQLNPYTWIGYFELRGHFLPSLALSCNILVALYKQRYIKEIDEVLLQYINHVSDREWYAQNTIVDWASQQIIHYPNKAHFSTTRADNTINKSITRKEYSFNEKIISDESLEEALQIPEYETFIKNFTGLQDPKILRDIEKYFQKTLRLWRPDYSPYKTDKTAVWLGSTDKEFGISTCTSLDYGGIARGISVNISKTQT